MMVDCSLLGDWRGGGCAWAGSPALVWGTRMSVLVWCLYFVPGLVRGGLRDVLLLALWGASLGLVRGPGRGTVVSGCGIDDWGFGEGLCTLSVDVLGCESVFRCDCLTRPCCGVVI